MDAWSTLRRPVCELRPGDHAWLAYRGVAEQECVVGAFVRGGLAAGHRVIYVTELDAGCLPGLSSDELSPHLATGRLRLVSERGACLRADGRFDPALLHERLRDEVRAAELDGYAEVSVTLDLTWAVDQPGGFEALLECERLLAEVLRHGGRLVCQFDRRVCTGDQFAALADRHLLQAAADPYFDDSVLRLTRTFQPYGLALSGEVDAARHTPLTAALSALDEGSHTEVHLDLGELRFIDLGGLNLIAEHATRAGRRGTFVLDRVPPQLRTVMDVVGWRMLPGLRLGDDGDIRDGTGSW